MDCPRCHSPDVVKKGKRKLRFETVQTYQCKNCGRWFQDKHLQAKTYPPRVIYTAVNTYYQGFTLDETRKQVNKRFKVKTSVGTVYYWMKEFERLCPIRSVRKHFQSVDKVVFRKRFEHENLDYKFMYHTYKLDEKVKTMFPSLYGYLRRFEQGCPDEFFEVGKRCSQPSFETKITPRKTRNLACEMTDFAVKAARNNYERHDMVEEFMLVNDTATVACEIPVWYWEKNIDNGVTGHIDILQVRNDKVYILDFKPGASKDKKAAGQLYHYALALSFRAKIPFENIRCAWFDKDDYFEFNPLKSRRRKEIIVELSD